MQTPFNCAVCGQLVDPRLAHPACSQTCGSEQCKATYYRQCIRVFDQHRQQQRIKEFQQRGFDMVTCAVCNRHFEMIGYNHLKTHGLTVQEYAELYPELPRLNSRMKQQRGRESKKRSRYLHYNGNQIDQKFHEFITGCLLGDGSLERRSKVRNARYVEGGSNPKYLEWKYNFIKQYFPCSFDERLSAPHTKTRKRYQGWWLRTTVHPEITKLHAQWYSSQKVIPQNIIQKYLTDFALTVWFCDDGCSTEGIFFYTFGFSEAEVRFLSTLLQSRFDLFSSILKNQQNQFMIRLNAESKKRFRKITSKFIIPGMEYKLDF